ncbi:NAD-dependent epimerase/dehydratase family protein [Clostridium thermobutyricum]|uniref:NAD-dependent epimerase/dehydratase family protein n=1 Tax=Clostridium thermobutyricum TaxID=29372 RepID=UPI0018AA41D8|nr:NAD(P)-dependent oxidoreductase [Clostridium thermobutyricum]
MKILITGVYGVIGRFLCESLKNEHEIIGIGRRDIYEKCHKYYKCDITDKEEVKKVFEENKDIDFIIHCAALAHNKGNDLSKDRFMKVNYEATKYITDLSNKILNLKNFIFISTISVYGEKMDRDIYLETDQCFPKSPYAVAKKKSEEYIQKNYKGNFTIFRLAPVYSRDFMLNIQRRTEVKGIQYRVGKGDTKLSICNIKNISLATEYVIKNYKKENSEIYNIADKKVCDFNDLINCIGNKKLKIIVPKILIKMISNINERIIKKQFIYENTIKLITDNIYSAEKLNNKIDISYSIGDID